MANCKCSGHWCTCRQWFEPLGSNWSQAKPVPMDFINLEKKVCEIEIKLDKLIDTILDVIKPKDGNEKETNRATDSNSDSTLV